MGGERKERERGGQKRGQMEKERKRREGRGGMGGKEEREGGWTEQTGRKMRHGE